MYRHIPFKTSFEKIYLNLFTVNQFQKYSRRKNSDVINKCPPNVPKVGNSDIGLAKNQPIVQMFGEPLHFHMEINL